MAKTISTDIRQRRDTAANWSTNNTILRDGQLGYETDTRKVKIGRGVVWNETLYINNGAISPTVQTVSTSDPSTPTSVTIPSGYSKYRVGVYLPNGQKDDSRIIVDKDGVVSDTEIYVNTFGDTLNVVFF